MRTGYRFLIGALLALMAWPATAAGGWQNSILLYGQGVYLDGSAKFTDAERRVEVDVESHDIVDKLKVAGFGRYRGENDTWALVADVNAANLGDHKQTNLGKTELSFDMTIMQLDAAYKMNQTWELFAGARWVQWKSYIDITPAITQDRYRIKSDTDMIDPIVGFRGIGKFGAEGKGRVAFQGDIGGGGGTDFTWQSILTLGYQATENWSVWLGARILSLDYTDQGSRNKSSGNLKMWGPTFGVGIHF